LRVLGALGGKQGGGRGEQREEERRFHTRSRVGRSVAKGTLKRREVHKRVEVKGQPPVGRVRRSCR
jgi:hypothetical protein